jgi:replicative DNA helicase
VLRAFATGTKPVYRMMTRLGRTVRATANHKFLTIQGWRRLDELAPGNRLAVRWEAPLSTQPARAMSAMDSLPVGASPRERPATKPPPALISTQPALGGIALIVGDRKGSPLRCDDGDDIRRVSSELVNHPDGDVYWDEITSIELDGETEVYDLTIEGLHNFVANDIVAHNSIEQDADIVMFIYREELYDKDTDKKGIAELHIAKHRNGPIGVVPMRFDAATTRFDDLTYRTPDGY